VHAIAVQFKNSSVKYFLSGFASTDGNFKAFSVEILGFVVPHRIQIFVWVHEREVSTTTLDSHIKGSRVHPIVEYIDVDDGKHIIIIIAIHSQ